MKSLDNHILKLLSNNDVTFYIPPYQRNYEWEKEQCKILLDDINKLATNQDGSEHFFGTVIYYAESTILGQPDKYILVDGQQRLTTTMLILIALRDKIKDKATKEYIEKKYLKNDSVEGELEYKVKLKQVESDWEVYKNIVLGYPVDDGDKSSRVYQNYGYYLAEFEKYTQEELTDLVENGINKLSIVTIQLEPEKNTWEKPQEIFESMNSLGKPLSLADLVRNYLLLGKTSEQQEKLYREYWLNIEKNLSNLPNQFSVSSFIRDYMQLIQGKSYKKATETNYKELYREFKSLFYDTENHEKLLVELRELSFCYAIIGGKSSGAEKIDNIIQDLTRIEFSSFYSFILGILRLQKDNKLSNIDVYDILESMFFYICRRRVLRITQGENMNVPTLVKYFDEIIKSDNKKDKIFEILSDLPYALRLPNNNEILASLQAPGANFYNLKGCKLVLSLIEEKITKSRPDMDDPLLQIEHIMPQTLNQAWKNKLGENAVEIHDEYINNIGNLTLIRHNQELGNKPFDDKKEVYETKAGLQIAKNKIVDNDKWGQYEIINRAKYISDLIVDKVFPISVNLAKTNNWSQEKKSSNALSFEELNLIDEEIYLMENPSYVAKVIDSKTLLYKDKKYKLSPLTREIMTELGKVNKSGAYWGVDRWGYQGKTLKKLMEESFNEEYEEG
ncbi:hypothetical protein FACS189431_5710 [Alphaproteobacteria bacterium]|nr:hypothetical protein FACS189431_5710 [Alphaproteobacteria bacterium]